MRELNGEDIADAVALAAQKHRSQTDKQGAPYIHHVLTVAARVRHLGPQFEITALLHDIVEDTDVTLDEVHSRFGDEVATAVACMTRVDGQDYFGIYLDSIAANPIARHVKYADSSDNLSKAAGLRDPEQKAWFEEKYSRVLDRLRPYLKVDTVAP